jgi:hypothetical protein
MKAHFSLKFCNPNILDSITVVHYGSEIFSKDLFTQIKNYPKDHERGGIKPEGGLWTCPAKSNLSWKDYCIQGKEENLDKNSFSLRLNQRMKVIVIDSYEDLRFLPKRLDDPHFVDWELLAKFGDAVWLTDKGCHETILSEPYHLCGWDCESILVMNIDPIAIQ